MSPHAPLDTFMQRSAAWLNMHLVDHGFTRAIYNNFFDLGGGMFRSSQPSPAQLKRYVREHGIRSVVNLRGPNPYGSYPLEVDACQRLGIGLYDSPIFSRRAPRLAEVESLKHVFGTLTYPALLHCKAGADRAGIASALYRILHLGHEPEAALQELSWKYGHFRQAKTGILDFFLLTYIQRNQRSPIALMDWMRSEYDYQALEAKFQTEGWANLVVDKVLNRE